MWVNYFVTLYLAAWRICRTSPELTRIPEFPNQFTMTYEQVNTEKKTVFAQKEFYDFKARLVRFDMFPEPGTELRRKYGPHSLIIVWDFNSGHQYVTDRWQLNCSITKIPTDARFPTTNIGHGHVQMKRAVDFIRDQYDHVVKLTDKAHVRGMLANVWELKKDDGTYHKIYFMDKGWESFTESNDSSVKEPLLAMEHYANKSSMALLLQTNVVDYSPAHPEIDVFDVTTCFSWFGGQMKLLFKLYGTFTKYITVGKYYVLSTLRSEIAKNAGISPIRISKIRVSP